MCLITNQKRAKIAKEDIICYKVILNKNGRLLSPYQEYRWYKNKLTSIDEFTCTTYNIWKNVYKGLHACTSIDRAKWSIKFTWGSNIQIHESTIPKGSKYYISIDGKEIVSNQMILGKRVWKNF